MNLLSQSLSNRDKSHSNPPKGYLDWKVWGCLGQMLCMSDNPKATDKYASSVIPGYIDSVRGEPLTILLNME